MIAKMLSAFDPKKHGGEVMADNARGVEAFSDNDKNTALDSFSSEFETQEQVDSYDRWLRAKVQAAIDDPRPLIPHNEVMRCMEERLTALRKLRGSN